MNINKINICNNCGKKGHLFHQCKLPITSYGIILFKYNSDKLEYLMIRRKDSFGYIDFIRGKYSPNNLPQIISIFNQMSKIEKERILSTNAFDELWKNMWCETKFTNNQYKNEEISSKKKFELLKKGITINDNIITLNDIINMTTTNWTEPEWEFPKGRRNSNEKELECALREFEEETGIKKTNIRIIENVIPFEEIFIGSNHKPYKHRYFLAYYKNENKNNLLEKFQKTEVSKLEWKTLENCLESIRPYNLEKKELILNINKVLEEYRLYT